MHSVCLQSLKPAPTPSLPCPLLIPHPTRAYFSFVHAAWHPAFRRFLLSQTERWAQFRSAGLPSTFSSHRLPWCSSCPYIPLSSISHPLFSPLLFPFLPSPLRFPPFPSLFLLLWLLIGCLSACGSCVFVCNRAERLVWIQRWENLFMCKMHRWRQVSRHRGLFLAVILHSGPDRRSEMGKYARRSAQIPKLHPAIQSMCVSVYSYLTKWFWVWMCVCVSKMACLIRLPSVRGPLALSDRRKKVYQLFFFYPIPVISFSFSDKLSLFSGAKIQNPLFLSDVCAAQTAHLVFLYSPLFGRAAAFVSECLQQFVCVSHVTLTSRLLGLLAFFFVSPFRAAACYLNPALQLNNLSGVSWLLKTLQLCTVSFARHSSSLNEDKLMVWNNMLRGEILKHN